MIGWLWSSLKALMRKGTRVRGIDPRPALSGMAPGMWASNHLAEAARMEGWQFVAVRTLSRMASEAELQVFEAGSKPEKRQRIRRALWWAKLVGDRKGVRTWRRRLALLKAQAARKRRKATADSAENDRRLAGDEHPLVKLLRRPNPQWSLSTFLYAYAQQLSLTGSCLIWCVRDEFNTPRELYVLPTGLCQSRMPTAAYPRGSYYLTPLSAWGLASPQGDWAEGTLGSALLTGAEIDARDVKAVRWPHPIYLSDGLSPLAAIRLWVDVANETDRATWHSLQNSVRPGATFEHLPDFPPPDPDDMAQFREDLKAEHAGTPNTGAHLIVPRGLTAKDRGQGVDDLDFPAGRSAYRDMNLAAHGVSQIAAGIMEAKALAAYRAALRQTTDLAVQPTLSLLAGELTELLGPDFDGPRCEIKLNAKSVNDPEELENRLRTDIQAGNAVRVDEYRAIRGLPKIGGKLGAQFIGQRTSVRMVDKDPEEPGVQGEQSDVLAEWRESET